MSPTRKCLEALMMAFMELRKVCGNNVPVKNNPTKNLCHESSTGICNITNCPLLQPVKQEPEPKVGDARPFGEVFDSLLNGSFFNI